MISEKETELMSCSKEHENHCVYSQAYSSCTNDKCWIKHQQNEIEEESWQDLWGL